MTHPSEQSIRDDLAATINDACEAWLKGPLDTAMPEFAADLILASPAIRRIQAEASQATGSRILADALRYRAAIDRVRDALAGYPKCDVHPDGDPVKCGWKQAVIDVTRALNEGDPDE